MQPSDWETVGELVAWLDENSPVAPETDRLLRVMKLSEEVGEVSQAVIGVLGQNPRKGVTHRWEDVQAELCDVIVTAMVALTTLTADAPGVFEGHLDRVAARSLGRGESDTPVGGQATGRWSDRRTKIAGDSSLKRT